MAISLSGTLHEKEFKAHVAKNAILIEIDGKACLAHNRWFSKEAAIEMIEALQGFVGDIHT